MRTFSTLGLAVSVLVLPLALGADWPQWNGPHRDGISPEKGLLQTWPKQGPPLAWMIENAGTGYTAPAVVGGKIYLMGARDKTEHLFALDADGKELWATAIGPVYDFQVNTWVNGPNGTPAVAGDTVVGLGSQGILLCTDTAGKERWRKNLPAELAAEVDTVQSPVKSPAWGFTWSPLIDGDQVIITPGGPQGLVAALDRKTGAVLWQSKEVKDPATYSSPILAETGGVKQVVVMVQTGAVGVSARDGSLLWRYKRGDAYPDIVSPTPLVKGNQVYLTAGWNGGCALLDVVPDGKKFKATEVYQKKEIGNRLGGVVLLDGFVYGFHETRNWMCQEWANGDIKWESPRRGANSFGVGSVIYADGNLYVQGEEGEVGLIAASPQKCTLKGKLKLPKESSQRKSNGKVWTHPVIADGRLYLRDQELLFCYKIK